MTGLPLRPELVGRTPYGAPQLEVPVRLNVNENPYPPSAGLVADIAAAVGRAARSLNRYPDRDAVGLRTGLADYLGHGLDASQVWAANGSNEVMVQLLQAFGGPGRTVMTYVPSYSMYPDYAALTGTMLVRLDRDAGFGIDPSAAAGHDVVVVARPNNPTGTGLPLAVIEALCAAATGMVIVDEAYQEFSAHTSALALLERFPRLVVTRTMSKAFAFAGGRVGYLAASRDVVEALQLVRLPYHLSAPTQAAALAALGHARETLGSVAQVVADREVLAKSLAAQGFPVVPSDANFLLVGGLTEPAATFAALLARGILVRDVGIPGHLRVTVGTTEECAQLLDAWTAVTPDNVI
jgi:histidinol-phosphate aminotransferase